jgi:1-acyl-sn-glycerol-3-phosphate acyltransferase
MLVHPVYRIVVFAAKMMFHELFDGNVYGEENIPRSGPCLVACNHLSYFDPPFVGSAVRRREVYSLARDSLFRTKFRNWLFKNMNCIPLARHSGDIGAIKAALKLLKNGKCIMIYPEGTRSKDGNIGEPQAGVGLLACKTGAPVVPCKVSGTFDIMGRGSKFFNWNCDASVTFGKPLLSCDYANYTTSGGSNVYKVAAEVIMRAVQNL